MDHMSNIRGQASQPHTSHAITLRPLAGDDLRRQILRAIDVYWRKHRCPPTIREIGKEIGIASTGHVAYHVRILEQQKLVCHVPGRSRGIMLTRPLGLPLHGTIAAGEPLDQFDPESYELLDLGELTGAMTAFPAGAASEVYALQVRGDSMIEDGILNGDFVLIAPGSTATNGDTVVALQNNANGGLGAATLKRFVRTADGVHLQPANAMHNERFIPGQEWDREWTVQGTLVAVYRQYGR